MIILSGVGILAMTLLLFGWAYGAMRRPDPKAWVDNEILASGIVFGLTAAVAMTLGLLVQAVIAYDTLLAETGPSVLAVAAGISVAATLGARLLAAPARRHSGVSTRAQITKPHTVPTAANDNAAATRHAA